MDPLVRIPDNPIRGCGSPVYFKRSMNFLRNSPQPRLLPIAYVKDHIITEDVLFQWKVRPADLLLTMVETIYRNTIEMVSRFLPNIFRENFMILRRKIHILCLLITFNKKESSLINRLLAMARSKRINIDHLISKAARSVCERKSEVFTIVSCLIDLRVLPVRYLLGSAKLIMNSVCESTINSEVPQHLRLYWSPSVKKLLFVYLSLLGRPVEHKKHAVDSGLNHWFRETYDRGRCLSKVCEVGFTRRCQAFHTFFRGSPNSIICRSLVN